ncbi:MAG: prolipoprotein diacylglyceryl transferase [Nitrospinae bacterium]|nr:prolipoprotein diacylglyceryl transferase [Nitrospinota bacterium]
MHPVLFEFGPITIHTYGLLVASGFMLGIAWTARLGNKEGFDPQVVYDTAFWLVLSAILSSRLAYVIVEYKHFATHPLDIVKFWEGGLVFYGGVIGAVLALYICAKKYGFNLWKFGDIAAPGVALGHVLGRLGCFFAGCCYGQETNVPWAVTFRDVKSIAPLDVPLHPTQLYDALNELIVFGILTLIRPYKKFNGQIWWTWVGLYSSGRIVVESFRGDPRGFWFHGLLSTSQILGALGVTLAIAMYFKKRKDAAGADAGRD